MQSYARHTQTPPVNPARNVEVERWLKTGQKLGWRWDAGEETSLLNPRNSMLKKTTSRWLQIFLCKCIKAANLQHECVWWPSTQSCIRINMHKQTGLHRGGKSSWWIFCQSHWGVKCDYQRQPLLMTFGPGSVCSSGSVWFSGFIKACCQFAWWLWTPPLFNSFICVSLGVILFFPSVGFCRY